MRFAAFLCLSIFATICSAETLVYFGTYTRGDSSSEGIYVSTFDQDSGKLSKPKLAAKANDPSFVAFHPSGKFLYAVSEVGPADEKPVGLIAYSILADGTLKKLNERSTGGAATCHVAVDPTGQCVGVANYTGGSCASFPINDDGSLGEMGSFHQHVGSSVDRRQKSPHAHSINFSADSTQAFVADLGLDKIVIYDVDPKLGTMTLSKQGSLKTPAGGGPRHFCFTPSGNLAVTNLEITSQVALLRYDPAKKTLELGPVLSSLPAGVTVKNNSTAECLVHPNGKFCYVSNRGHNSIAIFQIDSDGGGLTASGHQSTEGEIPRGFGIDPSGKFIVVANQKTGNIVSLRIDADTGSLSPTGNEIKVGMPVNVRFLEH